jgi:hypothetical protein
MIQINENVSEFFTRPDLVVQALTLVLQHRPDVGSVPTFLASSVAEARELGWVTVGWRGEDPYYSAIQYYAITSAGRAVLRVVVSDRISTLRGGE